MKRRTFVKAVSLATAGVITAPFILPTGRLFAASGKRRANHVVFFLFGGGLRNQETVNMQYLSSQGQAIAGNIMPNILKGSPPAKSLVYNPWTAALSKPLSMQGTLFQEVSYKSGPTGHFNGHTVAMTGNYTETGLNLAVNPQYPTVFEYYRKHYDPARSAINAWWLSESLGPYVALNYSSHPQYGAQYGANYFSPSTTFLTLGKKYFGNIPDIQPDDINRINDVKSFLDANFRHNASDLPGIINTPADKQSIESFIKNTIARTYAGGIEWPLPAGISTTELTGDLINVAYTWEVLNAFKPELTVVNTINSDVCHTDFSNYLVNIYKADYGVGWLWNKIQADPVLANDTILICMPEHGRNLDYNGLVDKNGFHAYDHTSDDNSRRIFALVVGPPSIVKQGQVIGAKGNAIGESIDIVPTIADILGFHDLIPGGMLPGRVLTEAFA